MQTAYRLFLQEKHMVYRIALLAIIALSGSNQVAWAEDHISESIVQIIEPKPDSEMDMGKPVELKYNVILAGKGDRIEVYLDDQKQVRLHKMEGSYFLERLPMGHHEVCIKVTDKKNQPTGDQECVEFYGTSLKGWRY
jgi:hypothetical protein